MVKCSTNQQQHLFAPLDDVFTRIQAKPCIFTPGCLNPRVTIKTLHIVWIYYVLGSFQVLQTPLVICRDRYFADISVGLCEAAINLSFSCNRRLLYRGRINRLSTSYQQQCYVKTARYRTKRVVELGSSSWRLWLSNHEACFMHDL